MELGDHVNSKMGRSILRALTIDLPMELSSQWISIAEPPKPTSWVPSDLGGSAAEFSDHVNSLGRSI